MKNKERKYSNEYLKWFLTEVKKKRITVINSNTFLINYAKAETTGEVLKVNRKTLYGVYCHSKIQKIIDQGGIKKKIVKVKATIRKVSKHMPKIMGPEEI